MQPTNVQAVVDQGFDDHSTIGACLDELNRRAESATGEDLTEIQDGLQQLTRLQGSLA